MYVYRIEHPDTESGPYSTDAMHAYESHATAHDDRLQPPPWADGLDGWRNRSGHRFGFCSLADLAKWFHHTEGRIAMARKGWKPFKLKIDGRGGNVVRGNRQLTFNRDRAAVVAELDPKTLQEI